MTKSSGWLRYLMDNWIWLLLSWKLVIHCILSEQTSFSRKEARLEKQIDRSTSILPFASLYLKFAFSCKILNLRDILVLFCQ